MTSPRLLKENAESLSQGLSWTFLSKTFQHALGIARAAGFRYMWIDSLCIIQDDPDDLRHEIQHMGDIDSNATLSIFALQPGKCFTRRVSKNRGTISGKPPTPRLRYQAKTSSERSNSYEVFACLAVDDDRYWKPKPYDHTFDNQSEKGSFYLPSTSSELFSRGWVFQEWLLGRRALIFGELELGLSCPHGHTSETRGFKLDEEFDLSLSGGMKRFVGVHNALTHADRGHDSWHRIASCYGSTEVNVSAYRTLAIEGLARRFRPDFARAYFAGCWLDYLPNDLLWFPATENVEYGAGLYSEFRTFSSAQTIDPPYISSECLPRNSHMVMVSVSRSGYIPALCPEAEAQNAILLHRHDQGGVQDGYRLGARHPPHSGAQSLRPCTAYYAGPTCARPETHRHNAGPNPSRIAVRR